MTNTPLQDRIDALSDLVRGIEDDHYPTTSDYVQALRMIVETAESALPLAVEEARAEGATWEQVARLLGTTRQSAWKRFGGEA